MKGRVSNNNCSRPSVPKLQVFLRLPYLVDRISTIMCAKVKKSFETVFKSCNHLIIWNVTRAINCRLNDKLSIANTCGVVYKFTCNCSAFHIGQTDNQLCERCKQHLPKWALSQEKKRPRSC